VAVGTTETIGGGKDSHNPRQRHSPANRRKTSTSKPKQPGQASSTAGVLRRRKKPSGRSELTPPERSAQSNAQKEGT
jgi:hypothetical protein